MAVLLDKAWRFAARLPRALRRSFGISGSSPDAPAAPPPVDPTPPWVTSLTAAAFSTEPHHVAARRQLAWHYLEGQVDKLTFTRNGVHWTGSSRSVITKSLFVEGQYQQECLDGLLSWLERSTPSWRSSDYIVNVGANIGDTAIPLALRTGKRILACEPVLETFHLLRENVRQNDLDSLVFPEQLAIGSSSRTATVVLPCEPGQAEILGPERAQGFGPPGPECLTEEVAMLPLGRFLEAKGVHPSSLGLVWSDTQGYETEVIESGPSLWEAGVPLWVEFWPPGLKCHGGLPRFYSTCRRFFRGFIRESQFRDPRTLPDVEDIGRIESLPASITKTTPGQCLDILLVPHSLVLPA